MLRAATQGGLGVTDILDEVESEYHAEQLRQAAFRYAWVAGVIVLAVLIGAGGYQYWHARQTRLNASAAAAYFAAAKPADAVVAGDQAGRIAAAQRLASFAATAPAGYRALARLRQAALLADAGKLTDAQAIWDQIATDPLADPTLRNLASLLWVQRGLDTSDPAALRTRLVSLISADNPYHFLATETQAMLDLRLGQTSAARDLLRRLVNDPSAPQGVRGRDGAILSRLGG